MGLLPGEVEELTWGEALLVLRERRERERRFWQRQANIAYVQAALTARCVLEGSLGEVYEYFPFWTEEEIRERKLEACRTMLESMAGSRKTTPNPAEGRDAGSAEEARKQNGKEEWSE